MLENSKRARKLGQIFIYLAGAIVIIAMLLTVIGAMSEGHLLAATFLGGIFGMLGGLCLLYAIDQLEQHRAARHARLRTRSW